MVLWSHVSKAFHRSRYTPATSFLFSNSVSRFSNISVIASVVEYLYLNPNWYSSISI